MAQDIPADKGPQVFFVDDDLIERLLRGIQLRFRLNRSELLFRAVWRRPSNWRPRESWTTRCASSKVGSIAAKMPSKYTTVSAIFALSNRIGTKRNSITRR